MEERISNIESTLDDFTPPFKAVMVKLDQHSMQLEGLRLQLNELEGAQYEQSAISHRHTRDIREMSKKIDALTEIVKANFDTIIALLSKQPGE